jgi:hypothetical protein
MPYYVNVRRYQSESSNISADNLINTTAFKPTDINIKTNTKYYVYYLIDIYYSTISSFVTWQTASDKGKLVSSNSSTNVNNGLASGLTTNVTVQINSNNTSAITNGDVIKENSHNKVSFSRKAGVVSGAVTANPSIGVQWKSAASPNWTAITDVYWGTTNNKKPSITWTTVVTSPQFPSIAIQNFIAAQYGTTPVMQKNTILAQDQITVLSNYVWDKCNGGLWHFVVQFKTAQYGGRGNQEHFTCTENGDQIQSKGTPSADILADKKKLANWTRKYVTDPMIAAKSNGGCEDVGSGNGLKDITTVEPPKGDVRWNPPTHIDSRGPSYGERVIYKNNDEFNPLPTAFAYKERGRIYQDTNSAEILNKDPDKLKNLISSTTSTNQWGFRFMYNPSTFSYQSSSNNAVDWTLGSSDPATLLSGNSLVTFEVYINRIPDLKYLRLKNKKVLEDKIYGRTLDPVEREGILNRGTEYDIEFLYRVLNGDPLRESLLFNSAYKGFTSDFGFTTAVPCWLVLNENLRYYGSVASFNVNHAMFDLNMVPMLSTVSISFARYPALWNEKTAFGDKVSVASIKEYLKNSGKSTG